MPDDPLFKVWVANLDYPEISPSIVEFHQADSLDDVCNKLAAKCLPDPVAKGYIPAYLIELWELKRPHAFPISKAEGWRHTVAKYKGKLDEIATIVGLTRNIGSLRPRLPNPGLVTLAVRRVPLEIKSKEKGSGNVGSLDTFYIRNYERPIKRQRTNALTPSETITPASYRSMQGKEFPIYDGRHPEDQGIVSSTLAMAISLYHPIFAKYLHWMSDRSITPSPECIAATARLMSAASVLYPTENDRKHAIRGPLQVVLGNTIRTVCNPDKTEADGQTIIALNMNDSVCAVPVLISEEKREPDVDAATQASLSMLRTWCDFNLDDFRNLGCCPTFLIGLDGCHLVICGAVLTNKCIVNRLAMLWVGRSSTHDESNTVNLARAFHALSLAIEELERWYKDIAQYRPIYTSQVNDHPRFFPFPDRYPLNGEDFSAGTIQFKYLRPMEESSTCVTFLAQMQPNNRADKKHIVVKFVQSYSPELHQLLAEQRMAPDLLYCGRIDQNTPLGNWKLVVMEYFDGRPSYERELHTTEQVRRRVEDIVKFAHEHGFVLGDIRPPNVLVGGRNDIRMIDFDWAVRLGKFGTQHTCRLGFGHLESSPLCLLRRPTTTI